MMGHSKAGSLRVAYVLSSCGLLSSVHLSLCKCKGRQLLGVGTSGAAAGMGLEDLHSLLIRAWS